MSTKIFFATLAMIGAVSASTTISPHSRRELCLTVTGGKAIAGAKVELAKCFQDTNPNSEFQRWEEIREHIGGLQPIILSSSVSNSSVGLCLDRGDESVVIGHSDVTIQECGSPNPIPAQLWSYTENHNLFAYFGDNKKCLDIVNDSKTTEGEPFGIEKEVATWPCLDNNANQVWDLTDGVASGVLNVFAHAGKHS